MFRFYTEERGVFTFDDYGALLAAAREANAKSILEFGPGASTLALIEAGCERIVTCEYQQPWLSAAAERLAPYPQVDLRRYVNVSDVEVEGLARDEAFDLAFVDSPLGCEAKRKIEIPGQEGCSRLNTLIYALGRAPVVLFHDAKRAGEQRSIERVRAMGHSVEMIDTVKGMARIVRGGSR